MCKLRTVGLPALVVGAIGFSIACGGHSVLLVFKFGLFRLLAGLGGVGLGFLALLLNVSLYRLARTVAVGYFRAVHVSHSPVGLG